MWSAPAHGVDTECAVLAAPECGTAQTECDPLVRTSKPHLVGVRHPGVESEGRDWLAEGGLGCPPSVSSSQCPGR